jgi:hypothetical protein
MKTMATNSSGGPGRTRTSNQTVMSEPPTRRRIDNLPQPILVAEWLRPVSPIATLRGAPSDRRFQVWKRTLAMPAAGSEEFGDPP